jgi:hypothetical protein
MSLADRKISLAGEAKQQPQDGWSDLSAVARRAKAEAIPIASRINNGSAGLKLALIWARRIRAGVFRYHRSRPRQGQWASRPCFARPIAGSGGLDRNVPRSADHLRRSIRVASCISEVANGRFQKQKELFGKHWEVLHCDCLAWLRRIRIRLCEAPHDHCANQVTDVAKMRLAIRFSHRVRHAKLNHRFDRRVERIFFEREMDRSGRKISLASEAKQHGCEQPHLLIAKRNSLCPTS